MKYQTAMWVSLCVVCLFAGFNFGMITQQMATRTTLEEVASNLDGIQIDIDLNETKMIEGITDFYTPYFEEMTNEGALRLDNKPMYFSNDVNLEYDDANVGVNEQ